uniref:Uncharacterized protein n=1 Tax=Salarias fasciatus TaxID=181472 RepID=A0A672FKT0_SALFA
MPVAIRKRSWEEHVTHPSGLQYSYDDLDLVCCHGVDGEGLWMGSGEAKQGRRTRCASMPEGCHQLPSEDRARTLEETAYAVSSHPESEHLKLQESVTEGLHDNRACGGCCSDSPASEVADGHRERHGAGAAVSTMQESEEAICSDKHLDGPALNGTNESAGHKEDSTVKVRMRKVRPSREHARLDSMVLLLMKLDQLDQEIENALSATSSMGSTPTPLRSVSVFFHVLIFFFFLSILFWCICFCCKI